MDDIFYFKWRYTYDDYTIRLLCFQRQYKYRCILCFTALCFTVLVDASHINIICGDNGTGKTTIVEAILNYNKRYKGKIYINGEELKELSYSDIVYIPADYLISKFGVLEDKSKMSSGQRKKAQFDLSLLTDKSVYIIDEPTNFLDLENKEAIARLISDLHDKGKIIIMITHDKDIMNKLNNVETIYLERKVAI